MLLCFWLIIIVFLLYVSAAAELKNTCKKLIDAMINAVNQDGSQPAQMFLELPDRKVCPYSLRLCDLHVEINILMTNVRFYSQQLPEYYQVIKKPIAISSMKRKLSRYTSVDQLEEDLQLMVDNAIEVISSLNFVSFYL